MLCVVDQFPREALTMHVARRLTSSDAINVFAEPLLARGAPAQIRSDQGPVSDPGGWNPERDERLHAPVLRPPIVERCLANPLLAAQPGCRRTSRVSLEHSDDLLLRNPDRFIIRLTLWDFNAGR
jgi:hypothetical protein